MQSKSKPSRRVTKTSGVLATPTRHLTRETLRQTSSGKINRMIVQTLVDKQKLNLIKQSVRRRPIDVPISRSRSELPTEILFSNVLAVL